MLAFGSSGFSEQGIACPPGGAEWCINNGEQDLGAVPSHGCPCIRFETICSKAKAPAGVMAMLLAILTLTGEHFQ